MRDTVSSLVLYGIFLAICLFVIPCRGAMASPDQARRALDTAGYTDIKITDHVWACVAYRGCGSDAARFDAEATNPKGKRVKVYVCVGWPFKGSTIRTE